MTTTTTVIIDNHLINERRTIIFTDKEFKKVQELWNNTDPAIAELAQDGSIFENCSKWSDLRALHYKFLIAKNLITFDELPADQKNKEQNDTVRSLYFLLMALVRCLELRADTNVELVKVQRFSGSLINFEYSGSVALNVTPVVKKKPTRNLTVIVDNTKKKK
jgi:hypothetical protein